MSDRRPEPSEYDARYQRYLDIVPENDICPALVRQLEETRAVFAGFPESMLAFRYEPGKWTIREVLGHIVDTERIYGYRALSFARGDSAGLTRSDEELYVRAGQFDRYPLTDWLEEFTLVRRSNVALLSRLPREGWARTGMVSGIPITVRAIAYLMLGHERHHLRIVQERYLQAT